MRKLYETKFHRVKTVFIHYNNVNFKLELVSSFHLTVQNHLESPFFHVSLKGRSFYIMTSQCVTVTSQVRYQE